MQNFRAMTSVKKELASGVFYTAIAKYAGIFVMLAVTAVLSRILSVEDFGTVAIVTVIISFFSIFSDFGIGPAIIQYKDLDEKDLGGIFSFTVWSAFGLGLLFFACSWPIASFYKTPILQPVCQLLSINLFFATLNIVPNALLFKSKRFRFIAFRNLVVQSGSGVIAIIAALSGAGIYALLVNPILSSLALFVVNFRQHPLKVRLNAGIAPLRRIFSFSAYQFAFNVFNYFSRNLDKLLIGKYMGMEAAGYYGQSYRLMLLPLQNITNVVSPVMHPIFSEFQHDYRKLSESYLKVVRILAFIGFPLSVFLWFASSELVLLVFGPQWEASVSVFQILTLSVGVQIVLSTSGSIFQAANATRIMFLSGVLSTILNVGAICAGIFVFGTLEAVAWGICASFTFNFIQAYYLMYRRTFRLPWLPFWKTLLSPLLLAVCLCAVLLAAEAALPAMERLLSLMVKGMLSLIVCGCYIQFSGEYDIRKKIGIILHRKRA